MLSELTIRDFAIIERLTIEWSSGLNILTGETGAGKSIIIDAVGALMGGKVSADVVRGGAARAIVEGIFDLSGAEGHRDLHAVLEQYGLELEDGGLILTREIAGIGGRGVARVNGRAVPTAALQHVGEQLVDIHGQSEHLSLLRPREHLELLDRFAGLADERARLAGLVAELRGVDREQARVREEARQVAREQDLLRHEVAEIEAAALIEGEEGELLQARNRLRNVERLRTSVMAAYTAITGDEDRSGAVDLLGKAAATCAEAVAIDPVLGPESEALEAAAAQAGEAARALRGYLDRIDDDPHELEIVEERLLLIGDLKRKYGGTVADVLAYAERAQARLLAVERQDQLLAELEERRARLRRTVGGLAGEVSARRASAGERFQRAVESELADLNMGGTEFVVRLERAEDTDGVPIVIDGVERTLELDPTGVDRVEFLIAPNPGEAPKGLGRIASGGELARVSLALKTILSRVDRRATLIFDEVDVGVGGRGAPVVGQKLWRLTPEHQVLCVTHMPQVAAYADAHAVVAKGASDGTSRVMLRHLAPEERIDELAAMLGGQLGGAGARRNAEDLIGHAAAWKAEKSKEASRKLGKVLSSCPPLLSS